MGLHHGKVEGSAENRHKHHGLAGLFEWEHKGDEQAADQGGTPHHGDGIGRQRACNDAAVLEVGDHPAHNALLGGVLAEQQAGEQPEAGGAQKAPIGDSLFGLGTACHGGEQVYQPEHQTQRCQCQHGQRGADPGSGRDQKGAEQGTAGVAGVHGVHAPGAVCRVAADKDGAGVQDTALGNAHNEEGQRQQNGQAGQAHQAVAHRIADGQKQDAWLHAHFSHQRTGQQTRQQVADAQQAEQGAGHAVGKAVFFLQQADHHTAGNGADAAEKEGDEARVPQAGIPLFHRVLLAVFGGAAPVVAFIKAYSGQKARAVEPAEAKSAPSGSALPFVRWGASGFYFASPIDNDRIVRYDIVRHQTVIKETILPQTIQKGNHYAR